jgi:Caspase domain
MKRTSLFTHGYALLIGVGGDLPVTVQDAIALRDILISPQRCAYPPGQVMLLTKDQANRQGILDGLGWLINSVQRDERATAIVYFSGHGGFTPEYHLVPAGYDSQKIKKTAVSGAEFTQKLREIRAQKLLILLDCCYAAGMTTAKASSFKPSSFPPELASVLVQGSGKVFIASSRQDEVSRIGSPYSVFTQALREGLAGYGTSTRDGYAYIADVALYVGRVIPARTGGKQHPVLDMRHADNFALAYYAGGAKTPVPLADAQAILSPLAVVDADLIENYRAIFKQYQQNLAAVEARMSIFIDQAVVPLDLERTKEGILQKMAQLETQIQTMAQQQGW